MRYLLSKDIAAFSDDCFNAVDWINKTLENTENQPSKEVSVLIYKSKIHSYDQLKTILEYCRLWCQH